MTKLTNLAVETGIIWNIFISQLHLTKTTAAQNEDMLSYHNVRGLYIPAVVFVTNICLSQRD